MGRRGSGAEERRARGAAAAERARKNCRYEKLSFVIGRISVSLHCGQGTVVHTYIHGLGCVNSPLDLSEPRANFVGPLFASE